MLQIVHLLENIRLTIEHAPVPVVLVAVPVGIILLATFAGFVAKLIDQQTPNQSHH